MKIGNLNITKQMECGSTYTKTIRVPASKLGLPPTNPPTVDVYGITHVLEFTLNTDKTYFKLGVPADYDSGDIITHIHWTKSTINSDQSTKNVKWQVKYLAINGTSENCNAGESTLSIEDTYDSAVNGTQIVYQSGDMTIPDGSLEIHDMIELEIMAITPDGAALTDEPALAYLDFEYLAKHIPV